MDFTNKIYYKSSQSMTEIPDNTIDLVVTSPPYFNIKDYSKNGYQTDKHSTQNVGDLGSIDSYDNYINELLKVWKECERVLKPNGKLIINTPLMPMKKADYTTHYNRHIFNIDADIQNSIIKNIQNVFLLDVYIWNRTNATKNLMFGSYPFPRNFYAQNTSEFITVYVKDGAPINSIPKEIKEKSKLSQKEWVDFTQQIWNIPIPNKSDLAFGIHTAIMPEEIIRRCVRLFSFENDIVLDPFTGSGTTLKVAKELNRKYIGYELYDNYKNVINNKLNTVSNLFSDLQTNIIKNENLKISCTIDEVEVGYIEYFPDTIDNKIIINKLVVNEQDISLELLLLKKMEKYSIENNLKIIEYSQETNEINQILINLGFEANQLENKINYIKNL